MYIQGVNDDEQNYEFSGLWASKIWSLAGEWITSAHCKTNYKFNNCMYIEWLYVEEQQYVSKVSK